ncbi:MAG: AtpZ/AtpI family protein [Planctomycetota bacterium]
MNDPSPDRSRRRSRRMPDTISNKERRKVAHREQGQLHFRAQLGLFGVVGWAVSVPAVLGALAGWWLDVHAPQRFSWTIMLLLIGLLVGCAMAWTWLERQRRHATDAHDRERGANHGQATSNGGDTDQQR